MGGTGAFINHATGKPLTGRFHNDVLIDVTTGPRLEASVGMTAGIAVPGADAVFLEVGRIVTDRTGEVVTFEGGPRR